VSFSGGGYGAGVDAHEETDSKPGLFKRLTQSLRMIPASSSSKQAVSPDIFKAAETGNITELNAAMKAGMNVSVEDKLGRTLLLYAARAGQLATVKWLYEQHAPLDSMDKEGRNALHYAARRGHLEVATWLLEHGVSVQQTDMHALTPLHQATLGRSLPVCELLLKHGADLNSRDTNGHTALELAMRFEADSDGCMAQLIKFLQRWAEANP